jgi:predicted RNase H-like HicB family nuclease
MKDHHYLMTVCFSEADDGYIAEVPELKYCSAFGQTPREALEQLERARSAWLEAARSEGKLIPEPRLRPGFHG